MKENIEYTYCMLKPDGVRQNILDEVIRRFNDAGLEVSDIKEMMLTKELVREHYAHVVDRDFYPEMERQMLSGPVIAMIVIGPNAVSKVRELMGPTNSKNAMPGTIRGDYGNKELCCQNAIHGSDSLENAKIEINRFYDGSKSNNPENNKIMKLKKTREI